MHYTYILECRDQTLYTGWTTDLGRRLNAHNSGTGAKYTKSRVPVRLVYFERYETKQAAMKREYAIKQLSRKDKLALIRTKNPKMVTLSSVALDCHIDEKSRDTQMDETVSRDGLSNKGDGGL